MAYSTVESSARPVQPCPPSEAMNVTMLQRARACSRVGCAFAVWILFYPLSQNVMQVFEDQAFKTGI